VPQTLWCRGLFASIDPVPNPSVKELIACLRADSDLWGEADPMLELSWHQHACESPPPHPSASGVCLSQLLVIRSERYGFYFEYSGYRDGRWLVAIDPAGDRNSWIANMSHGAEAFFLTACFLVQNVGEQIVAEYLEKQRLSSVIEWLPFEPLCPRRDDPPHLQSLSRPGFVTRAAHRLRLAKLGD